MTSKRPDAPVSRGERILAFMAVGIAIVSFACLMAVLVAPLTGASPESMTAPIWSVLLAVAYIGFPLALLLMIALLVWRLVINRRANR